MSVDEDLVDEQPAPLVAGAISRGVEDARAADPRPLWDAYDAYRARLEQARGSTP